MKTIFSLVIGALLCGCGGSAGGPSVSLINLRFEDATALETTATFTLRLSNETPEAVQINGEVHRIYLNDLYLGKGLSDEKVEVPRLGTVRASNPSLKPRASSIASPASFTGNPCSARRVRKARASWS